MERVSRRHVLVLAVVLAVVLAGCAGGGGTPTATAADGASDGSNGGDAGSNDDDSASAATPTATATPTPTPTPNLSSRATPTETPEPLPRMSDLLEFEDSHRYSAEIQSNQGPVVQEGRWYEGDFVAEVTFEDEGRTYTAYQVDDRQAYVSENVCYSQNVPPTNEPGNWSKSSYLLSVDVRPSNTTTIDGETVYVYETESAPEGLEGPSTYYVSAETGYLVRGEFADTRVEWSDWGHDDAVELPC